MLGAFIGVIVINNPLQKLEGGIELSFRNMMFGTMYSLGGAIGWACAMLCMRYMRNIHYSVTPFWYATGCTFFSSIFLTI